jgi:hypothetical protein
MKSNRELDSFILLTKGSTALMRALGFSQHSEI